MDPQDNKDTIGRTAVTDAMSLLSGALEKSEARIQALTAELEDKNALIKALKEQPDDGGDWKQIKGVRKLAARLERGKKKTVELESELAARRDELDKVRDELRQRAEEILQQRKLLDERDREIAARDEALGSFKNSLDDTTVGLRIENLGDRRYREHGSGIDAPGRSVGLWLRAGLGR